MRTLLVSTFFPTELDTFVHGVHKRMGMFVDAIKETAQLHMLFYVPASVDVSRSTVALYEKRFANHWSADIKLFLCPRFEPHGKVSKWQWRWRHYGAGALSFFRHEVSNTTTGPEQVHAFERCLQAKPEMIFAHRLPAMCPPLLTEKTLPPIFFDLDDIEHVVHLRRILARPKLRTKLFSSFSLPALWWGERQAIKLATRTFVCSESDRRYLENLLRVQRIATVPNAVHIPSPQPLSSEPTLLFLGTYLYHPNVKAAEFLIEKVFPHVRRAVPKARLVFAGIAPEKIRGYHLNIPGIEFTGFVDDLERLYRGVRVVCAPLFAGVSGTQTKLIEAAAFGKPIVANRLGANGVEMRHGKELLVCDDPNSFAGACLQLLNDPARCQELGSAARARAIEFYNRANIISMIQKYINNGAIEKETSH